MPSGPRNLPQDAFYADERPLVPPLVPNPRGVDFNRFTLVVPGLPPTIEPMTQFIAMPNPLNPSVTAGLAQPEVIPSAFQGAQERYCIFIPPLVMAGLAAPQPITARVTLLFCVGSEFNRHGLRTFFAPKDDRVLITISGREGQTNPVVPAWGVGITDQQIRTLFTGAGFPSASFAVDTLAGYSTGHRGVNGTVNNGLISLNSVRRIVFLDALYRGDDPAPGSNTSRMLQKVRAANPNVELITYEVTSGGTPRDALGQTAVPVPAAGLINLKPQLDALKALIIARVSNEGVTDGYFSPAAVPSPIQQLTAALPPRGTLASSSLTQAAASSGKLSDWAAPRLTTIAAGLAQAGPLVAMIQSNVLTGWDFPDLDSMCHDGFMPEFGWEFLAG